MSSRRIIVRILSQIPPHPPSGKVPEEQLQQSSCSLLLSVKSATQKSSPMTQLHNSPTSPTRQYLRRAFTSVAAFGFFIAQHSGVAQEKPATQPAPGRPPKPAGPASARPRDPNTLKPHQVISPGPPPAAPTNFSPDFGARLFESLFSLPPASVFQLNVRTTLTPLRPDFNPDPQTATPWSSGGIERGIFGLRLDISETDLDRCQLIAADAAAQDLVDVSQYCVFDQILGTADV